MPVAVGNNLFLGFWTARSVPGFAQADYMSVYAALGVASALFSFMLSMSIAFVLFARIIMLSLTTAYVNQVCKFGRQSQYVQSCLGRCLAITRVILRHHTNG